MQLAMLQFELKLQKFIRKVTIIKIFIWGAISSDIRSEITFYGSARASRHIVGFIYTVGNLVLRRRASGAIKRDFRTYIRRYTSLNENVEYGYPLIIGRVHDLIIASALSYRLSP